MPEQVSSPDLIHLRNPGRLTVGPDRVIRRKNREPSCSNDPQPDRK
jgi:hypothetical protein